MIWKNAELYNVSELVPSDDGYMMARMSLDYAMYLSKDGQALNFNNCGCEIRFKINSDDARITISAADNTEIPTCTHAVVYYGGICAGWVDCYKNIFSYPTEIVIPKYKDTELLEKIHNEHNIPYSPDLVRVILQNRKTKIYDIKGYIVPPCGNDTPKRKYLAYGSSITHGSLALVPVNTWTSRVAENTKSDLINLGYAGNARLEPKIADYIAKRDDFDFATLEMGINILNMDSDEFRKRVNYFVKTIASAHRNKRIFCIDIFYCKSDLLCDGRASLFRSIVKEEVEALNLPNTVYVNGLDILTSAKGLSADLVHPNVRGVEEMARNLSSIIKTELGID